MNPILFLGVLSATAFLLTACPQTPLPPPPPSSTCTPTATGLSAQAFQVQSLTVTQGLGDFSAPYVPGELLVLPGSLLPQALSSQVEGVRIKGSLPGGFLHVQVPVGQERAKAQELSRRGAQFIQPNYLYRPLLEPNDPKYRPYQKPYFDLVGLADAWQSYTGSAQVVVAVADTGYQSHEDMPQNGSWYLPAGQTLDIANNDSDPWDDTPAATMQRDPFSHGLAVGSVLGAVTNNGKGITQETGGLGGIGGYAGLGNGGGGCAWLGFGVREALG